MTEKARAVEMPDTPPDSSATTKLARLARDRLVIGPVVGLLIGLLIIGLDMLRQATPPLAATGAVTWWDYWLNRYQTLLAGLTALTAAMGTIYVLRQQIETARADAATGALTAYANAIMNVMERHENAKPPSQGETFEEALQRLKELKEATDEPTMRAAMMDSVMGEDQRMMAMFLNSCRFSATGRVYGRDDQVRHTNMVWPLYIALTNGINRRKELLRDGVPVRRLYKLSTVDQTECMKAFVEGRMPKLF